jgi:ubiquinone/menaquinone biosynthesis C-methylase UbiE
MTDTPVDTARMKIDWNARAKRDPLHWTLNCVDEGEWDGEAYYETGETTVKGSLDNALENLAVSPEGLTVYEVGCGAGRLTVHLASRFKKVVAMDVSGEMLKAARAAAKAREIKNVKFVEGNGTDFQPQTDASVDVVYSAIVFQHIPNVDNQLGYIREMARILRPGGLFLISLYGNEEEYAFLKTEWEKRRAANDPLGWSALGALELPRYETSMSTPMPRKYLQETLDRAGMELLFERGSGTSIWWIGGRKQPA